MDKYIRLLRPKQWIKNSFVFTGILFSHQWYNTNLLLSVLLAFAAFCLISSSIYVINDLIDRDKDRHHPIKKHRPIASGEISTYQALLISIPLAAISFLIGYWISQAACTILAIYFLLNIAYSFYLKEVVILDVFCISLGFMLRILIGTIGVGIPPSNWLLLCGMMITLFLGYAKRRSEIVSLKEEGENHRGVLSLYSLSSLDQMIVISATAVITTYSLYAMSPATIAAHGTENLIYTVPFVVYGLFRYIFLMQSQNKGGAPSSDLFKDPHILITVLLWLITVIYFVSIETAALIP